MGCIGTGCTGMDGVDDTPNQAGPNYGCPEFPHVSCNSGPDRDMFMNFMDLVDDRCMVMFTKGQSIRVNACSKDHTHHSSMQRKIQR